MSCAQCQAVNPPGAKFCINCGAAMTSACPRCSAAVPPQARFCPECGLPLQQQAQAASPKPAVAPTMDGLQQYIPSELLSKLEYARSHGGMLGERRIVTMLFSDVRGSTAAASTLDPEEWAEIMKGAFEYLIAPIYRYEGTLARLMGDAILAFFGAPIAHEDDPQRAVLAGLEILSSIVPFKETVKKKWGLDFDVRIGINTGLVVVGEIGSDLRLEYTAMGDAINLAARMEETAQPGTVQISDSTYRTIAPLFDAQDLGLIEVKGKAEPVHAYRAIGPKAVPGQLRGIQGLQSILVGRDEELGALKQLVYDLRTGKGQVVSVMAEAGLGKSRLIAELHRWLADEGHIASPLAPLNGSAVSPDLPPIAWIEGRSLSYETSAPYAPFVDILEKWFGLRGDDSDAQKFQKITEGVAAVAPGRVDEVAPFLASLMDVRLTGEPLERVRYLEPPQLRGRVFGAVQEFVLAMASMRPLVLVFEDLHWSDSSSLELLEQLLPMTDHVPLMLLAVFRPQRQEPSWKFHEMASRDYNHRYTAIQLEPLDEEDTRSLVANLLHIEGLPEKMRNLILQKSEGNPFFVEEVIRSLLDSGAVVREGAHWRATREIEQMAVPDTISGVLTTRLDRLDEEARRVIQTASVIGREFQFDVLCDAYQSQVGLDMALTDLQRRGLLREKSRIPQRVYSFKHSLIQETAYASLLMSRRREIHLRVADSILRFDPKRVGDIARHYLEAREAAKALPCLVDAGENAARANSLPEAVAYFRQALNIMETVEAPSLSRRAYEGLGASLAFGFDIPGAVETFHKMHHVATTHNDLPMQVSALNKLGRMTAVMQGQFPEAEKHLIEAERLAILVHDQPGLSELHKTYCIIRTISGDLDGALDHQRRALQIGDSENDVDAKLFGASHCANSLTFLTRFDEAWPQATQALAAAEAAGNRRYMTEPLIFSLPWNLLRMGDLELAQKQVTRGTEMATQIGATDNEGVGAYLWGQIARVQGRYEEAIALQRRAYDAGRASGMLFIEAGALCALGTLYFAVSDKNLSRAEGYLSPGLKLMNHPFSLVLAAQSWTDIGFCALARGQADMAKELFQKALTEQTSMRYLVRPAALVGMARVALADGNAQEASRWVQEAKVFAEERGMRNYFPIIALAEAQLAETLGESSEYLDCFARAERQAMEMRMRPMTLQAQAGVAKALVRLGRQDEGEAAIGRAQATVQEIAALFQDTGLRSTFLEHARSLLAQ